MPMLCIHILQFSIFEVVLLVALMAGRMRVEAVSSRRASVECVSGHWEVSWAVLCSVASTVLELKVVGRSAR
jgi:hypothetical protein